MSVTFTTTDFVTAVKRVAHFPTGNTTFTTTDVLALGDMEMRTGVAPKVASVRENYWLTTKEFEINDANKYPIPSKAQGSAIVDVKMVSGSTYIPMVRLEIGQLYSTDYSTVPAYGYYLEDNNVRLNPANGVGNPIMWYYRIPSKLVPVSQCGAITDVTATTVTVSALPSAFVGGGELDIVDAEPGFNVLLKDTEPSDITGNVITFDAVPDTVQVGDYVCLSGQSCVVQCPLEWVEILIQRTAVKVYEIQGYEKKHKMASDVLEKMEERALNVVSPRTIESAKIIPAGGSLLQPQTRGWQLPVR